MFTRILSLYYYFIILIFISDSYAQQTQIYPPDYIKTIQLQGSNEKFSGTPIIKLGEPLSIRFDDITGEEADYYYRISHYNFDWTASNLNKNEYLDGFDEVRIVTYENSFNTLQMYSHYFFTIPNEDTRRLNVSGNYIIEVYDSEDKVIFSRKFIVYEDAANIKLAVKRSRNLNHINSKQSVQFEINSPNLLLINPKRNVKVMILQNNNLQTAITNLKPQFTIANSLVYKYDQESSFWGGNEFLSFDNKELRSATADIHKIELQDMYHNYLFTDVVRANRKYSFNPDINGYFVIRNLRAENQNVEADYVWMHFSLECYEPIGNGNIHIYGNFNNYQIDESTKMVYNEESKLYENKLLFKQGFYNYSYVLSNNDNTLNTGIISGNFDETENEYTIIAYYRAPTGRFDKVIGKASLKAVSILN